MSSKLSALILVLAIALTACSPAERVASSAPVLLGDVNNVQMYADDVEYLADDLGEPELFEQFEELMSSETEGVDGTPAQKVLATPGLEQFFEDYAQATGFSVGFERNLFACHVDNSEENIGTCIEDLYTATYDN